MCADKPGTHTKMLMSNISAVVLLVFFRGDITKCTEATSAGRGGRQGERKGEVAQSPWTLTAA